MDKQIFFHYRSYDVLFCFYSPSLLCIAQGRLYQPAPFLVNTSQQTFYWVSTLIDPDQPIDRSRVRSIRTFYWAGVMTLEGELLSNTSIAHRMVRRMDGLGSIASINLEAISMVIRL